MRINIETIPHESHRYETCGDYFYDDLGVLQVRVSDMSAVNDVKLSELYQKMVVIHELVEESITKFKGITEQQIIDFDLYYNERRKQKLVDELSEPGFDNNSPYLKEHTLATSIEMMMCALAGISWNDYDNFVMNL